MISLICPGSTASPASSGNSGSDTIVRPSSPTCALCAVITGSPPHATRLRLTLTGPSHTSRKNRARVAGIACVTLSSAQL